MRDRFLTYRNELRRWIRAGRDARYHWLDTKGPPYLTIPMVDPVDAPVQTVYVC
jgi:hypothetical protein